MKILVINPGSASKKYALYEDSAELAFVHFEKKHGGHMWSLRQNVHKNFKEIKRHGLSADYENAIFYALKKFHEVGIYDGPEDIGRIGIRIVAPGKYFEADRPVNAEFTRKLFADREMDPLHINLALREIEQAVKIFPDTKFTAISDSSFYSDSRKGRASIPCRAPMRKNSDYTAMDITAFRRSPC